MIVNRYLVETEIDRWIRTLEIKKNVMGASTLDISQTVSFSPTLVVKAGWVIFGQSLFLSPSHITELLLWGK